MPAGTPDPRKLKPLSQHGYDVLRWLLSRPLAGYEVNPGVRERLFREGLVDYVDGAPKPHTIAITPKGREKLAAHSAKP